MRAQFRILLLPCALLAAQLLASESTPSPAPSSPASASDSNLSELRQTFESTHDWTLTQKEKTSLRTARCEHASGWDLSGLRSLRITAACRSADPVLIHLRWRIITKGGELYEAAEPTALGALGPVTVSLPLTPDDGTLIPIGHQRPWDRLAAARVSAVELQAEWRAPYVVQELPISLTKLEAEAIATPTPPRLLDLELSPAPTDSRAKAILSFRIDPPPADPFALDGDGDVRVVQPDGQEVLAWFDQNLATVADGAAERSVPAGKPIWRAWVNSADAQAAFKIRSGSRVWSLRSIPFTNSVRNNPEAPRYRWLPPLTVAAPNFAGAFGALPAVFRWHAPGMWSPVQDSPGEQHWRPVPFWNSNWSGFDGGRTISYEEAARFDAELSAAARKGLARPLEILPGDTLGLSGPFNWSSHPLQAPGAARGSLLLQPQGFEFYARGMRYCIARWGASRAVRTLSITTALNTPNAPEVHAQLARWLSTLPPGSLQLPVLSYDRLAAPLNVTGSVESFSAAQTTPLIRWHADARVQRATVAVHPPAHSDELGYIEIKAADPAAKALALAGTYAFGAPEIVAHSDALTFDVFVPPDAPPDLRAGVHFSTPGGEWFDAVFAELLRPGEWNRCIVDLTTSNRNGLRCLSSAMIWNDACRASLAEIGIHLFTTHPNYAVNGKPQPLSMRVGPIRALRFSPESAVIPAVAQASAPRTWPPETLQTLSQFDSHDLELLDAWRADGRLGKASGAALYRAGPDSKTCFEVRAADAKTLSIGAVGRYLFGSAGDLSSADTLVYDLYIPPNAPPDLRTGLHFIDADGRWVETVLQAPPTPGEWTTFSVDLTAANTHRLHAYPADDHWQPGSLRRVFELGVHLFSTHPDWAARGETTTQPLAMRVANIRAVRALPHEDGQPAPKTADARDSLGAPTRVASLSDAKPSVYAWFADERTGSPCNGQVSVTEGLKVMSLQATQPHPAALCLTGKDSGRPSHWDQPAHDNLFSADALVFQVWSPADQPAGRVGVHVRDRNGEWFETLLPGTLIPNEWVTYAVDLTATNVHKLKPLGHTAAWTDYSRQRISELGIHVFPAALKDNAPNATAVFSVRIRDVHTIAFETIQSRKTDAAMMLYDPETQKERALNAAAARLGRGELWECHVQLNRTFDNPFDPRDCDLTALITTPSGKTVRVPAFFNQLCKRREATPGGDEIVEASGPEFFTVRYRATELGAHKISFELREGGKYDNDSDGRNRVRFIPGKVTARLDLPNPALTVTQRPATEAPFHGFMRCAADKRHFEFEDGTFFYPIGPCLRSPSDTRVPYLDQKWNGNEIARIGRRGSYQYDDYFADAAKNGVSWARVWMCSWWGGLEWRRDWPGYQGLGRYNLLNAWRIDHVLELAEGYGIEINLCLTNHGQFAPHVDSEWANNPYGSSFGGPLQAPREFFTRPEAKILHMNKLRYTVARFGHSPAVMAWALFSECEFTQEYSEHENNAPNVCDWHAEMANYLKEIDPNRHLVTTHFSHPHHGVDVLAIPEMDFATSNAYSAFGELTNRFDASEALASFWGGRGGFRGFIAYNKPALVEEQGHHFMGGQGNTRVNLDADLHAGIWGSLVQPLSGATGYWWWLHLHFDQRWNAYKPLAEFIKGEDFRPKPGEATLDPVELPVSHGDLHARALRSDRRLYAWVYHKNMPIAESTPAVSGASLQLSGLAAGKYRVQFWDTYKGVMTKESSITISGAYTLPLPTVDRDLAVKILPQ